MSLTRVVAITGCDSGLGWSIAARSAREGLVTVAGMFNGTETKAAEALKKLCAHPYTIDVTKTESVYRFREYVKNLIESNPGYKLHAVVNNAGVMTIGDYEWQTPSLIENTINVNLLGAMRVASAFLPDLRKTAAIESSDLKPRFINVASHCGLQALPGFAPYSASKSGLLAFTRALRMEHQRHRVAVTAFIPGGFVGASSLLANQATLGEIMLDHLNEEQKQVHEKRIRSLIEYLLPMKSLSQDTTFDSLKDVKIIEEFMNALLNPHPKLIYKVENLRYKIYYNLMNLPLPETVHHVLVRKFLNFPEP